MLFSEVDTVELRSGQSYRLPIVAGKTKRFYIDANKLPFSPSHVVFQSHSQWQQIKVSFDDSGSCSESELGRYSVGTDVGILSLAADHDPFSWCLSPTTLQNVTFKVLVVVLVYRNAGLYCTVVFSY